MIKKRLIGLITALAICIMMPAAMGSAAENGAKSAPVKRTILMYMCGSNLETNYGMASYNLRQVLRSRYSEDEDVKVVVMTGASNRWYMPNEYLVFPEEGVNVPEDAVVDISNYQVTMKTKMAYTGKPVKPAVKVSGVAASSYRVYYSSNTKVGVAKLTIRPTDSRYKGKITRSFKIVPKKATVSKATAGKGKMTVKAGKTAAGTGGTKYQVQYRRYGTYKWKSKKTKKRTLTIKKLTKGRKYQVRIRAFKKVGKKTYYGAWSKIKTTGKIK